MRPLSSAGGLPPCVVLLGKPDQALQGDAFASIGYNVTAIASEHLVYFAMNDQNITACHALLEWGEFEIQAALCGREMPRAHEVLRIVVEAHLVQFVNPPLEDECILRRGRCIAQAVAQVEADRAAIGQESRRAGPHPEAGIIPNTASPVEVAKASFGFDHNLALAALHPAAAGPPCRCRCSRRSCCCGAGGCRCREARAMSLRASRPSQNR